MHAIRILDTPPEPDFDDIVQLAALVCDSPISLLTFIDDHRQWAKASFGMALKDIPRELAFCNYAIQRPGLTQIEDALLHPGFEKNPLVTGTQGIRFYAGIPVSTQDGLPLGTLCVVDRRPRTLNPEQERCLAIIAEQVKVRLELRQQTHVLQTALKEAHAAKLRAETMEHRFQTFMDAGPFMAYMKSDDGRILYYNRAMADQFAVSATDFVGKTDEQLWPELAVTYRTHDLEVLDSGELKIHDEDTRNPDGSVSHWRSFKFPCSDADGRALLGGVSVNVTAERRHDRELRRYQTELEQANQRLNELASVDALTGLANRRVFDDTIRVKFRQARQTGACLTLLMIDVDHFKAHNDEFGHLQGDAILRKLASILRGAFRRGDLIARYGGEEFAVLLPDSPGEEAKRLADRLQCKVRETPWPDRNVTISIGISTLTGTTQDTHDLIGQADEALYAAKQAGRDQVMRHETVAQS